MEQMERQKKTFYLIDIFKFVCALLVLMIHTQPLSSFSELISAGLRTMVFPIAVPFFFATTGFFFFKKLSNSEPSETKNVIVGTEKRLVFLYLFYSAVYFPFVLKGWLSDGIQIKEVLSYLHSFFIYSSFSTIWYLLASAVAVLLAYVSFKKLGIKLGFLISLIPYCFGTLISSYYGIVNKIPFFSIIIDGYHTVFLHIKNGLLFGWVYVMLGGIIYKLYSENKIKSKPLLYVGMIGTFGMVCVEALAQYVFHWENKGVDLKFFLIPFTFFFICVLLMLEEKLSSLKLIQNNQNLWLHLRKLSILIFLLQRIPITLLEGVQMNSLVYTIVIFVFTLILSEMIIFLSTKISFFKKIY